jgi:hypothetical protein
VAAQGLLAGLREVTGWEAVPAHLPAQTPRHRHCLMRCCNHPQLLPAGACVSAPSTRNGSTSDTGTPPWWLGAVSNIAAPRVCWRHTAGTAADSAALLSASVRGAVVQRHSAGAHCSSFRTARKHCRALHVLLSAFATWLPNAGSRSGSTAADSAPQLPAAPHGRQPVDAARDCCCLQAAPAHARPTQVSRCLRQ